jgi:GTP 3',8-cyclase
LRYEEVLRVARIAVKLGITKIRLTGGEPLIRKGIGEFIPMLMSIEGLDDVSLTTNGVYLKKNLAMLKGAGIRRINVSLDSLNRRNFELITRFDAFDSVWEGIEKAEDMGFYPIKLNVVVMKGLNDHEIPDFCNLTLKKPYSVRFIECMPIGLDSNSTAFISNTDIKEAITREFGTLTPVDAGQYDGPATRFRLDSGKGEMGFISAVSYPFCNTCNRLRLTADGMLLPCLLSGREISIKDPLRSGCLDDELVEVFLKATDLKPMGHSLNSEDGQKGYRKMCSIGG